MEKISIKGWTIKPILIIMRLKAATEIPNSEFRIPN